MSTTGSHVHYREPCPLQGAMSTAGSHVHYREPCPLQGAMSTAGSHVHYREPCPLQGAMSSPPLRHISPLFPSPFTTPHNVISSPFLSLPFHPLHLSSLHPPSLPNPPAPHTSLPHSLLPVPCSSGVDKWFPLTLISRDDDVQGEILVEVCIEPKDAVS